MGSNADSEGLGEGHAHRIRTGRYGVAQTWGSSARLRGGSPQARQKSGLRETFLRLAHHKGTGTSGIFSLKVFLPEYFRVTVAHKALNHPLPLRQKTLGGQALTIG